jgi:6-phosphogluconate dehydrogenase
MQMGMVGPGRTGASMYDLNLPDITEVWRRGSVIASWLLDLTSSALAADPDLKTFAGRVSDSGEGRWTITAAIDEGVPAYVLSAALYERFSSRGQADFADQLLSAMRYQFGGHLEKGQTAAAAGKRDPSGPPRPPRAPAQSRCAWSWQMWMARSSRRTRF